VSWAHASDQDLNRFRTEAQAVARFHHPNIVQVYEVGDDQGLPYFSLEFCAGGSLEKKLAGTPLPPQDAARLIETLAHAVQAAHDKGIVHRDFRISSTTLSPKGAGCIQAIASSFDFTWISQKPAISPFDSVKGPPITIFLPP
jgi:serine/threonine-protein kinase